MTLTKILKEITDAPGPVVRILQKGDSFKVLGIGLKKSVILKEHKTPLPARLVVLEGNVKYREEGIELELAKYDEKEIPIQVLHSLEALEDSLCLLIVG